MLRMLAVSDEEELYGSGIKLPDFDILISCGDLRPGYLEYLLDRFQKRGIMVLGNHDEIYFHNTPEAGHSDIYRGMYVLKNDVLNLEKREDLSIKEALTIVGYSGAMANGERPFYFSEDEAQSFQKQLNRKTWFANFTIDIFLSHTPPAIEGMPTVSVHHQPSKGLARIFDEFRPKLWIYGHTHPKYTQEPLDFELDGSHVINACPFKYIEYDEVSGQVNYMKTEDF